MPRQRLKPARQPAPTPARPIVIVGAGNMGGALARGLIAKGLGPQLVVIEPALSASDLRRYRNAGVTAAKASTTVAGTKPRAIIFAIKPQMMPAVVPDYASVARGALVVSIAAGTTSANISGWLGGEYAIVRAMPNMPAAIGRGISAVFATHNVIPAQRALTERLLGAVGEVIWLEREELIDAVTAVSGSGPAYVFLLVEALAKAGAAVGLLPEVALKLARKTVEGAGALLAERKDNAEDLRRAVTSPGGTTEAALRILMSERGLEPLMRAAVAAATARGRELGK
jgi:pyrroline-5-carboxylate reductase